MFINFAMYIGVCVCVCVCVCVYKTRIFLSGITERKREVNLYLYTCVYVSSGMYLSFKPTVAILVYLSASDFLFNVYRLCAASTLN